MIRLKEFPGYAVSDSGKIIEEDTGVEVKQYHGADGFARVLLERDKRMYTPIKVITLMLLALNGCGIPDGIYQKLLSITDELDMRPKEGMLLSMIYELHGSGLGLTTIAKLLGISDKRVYYLSAMIRKEREILRSLGKDDTKLKFNDVDVLEEWHVGM